MYKHTRQSNAAPHITMLQETTGPCEIVEVDARNVRETDYAGDAEAEA